jgi:hypothetical protein
MMTGCRNQFLITKNPKTRKYICCAKYNPNEQKWSEHTNSSHDSDQACWRVDWPNVGGGGDANLELTEDELFQKVILWDENNYLIGAGTDGSSDKNTTNGVVDNHAYSIIDSRQDICGTGIDLLLVRNPWGKGGEIENGTYVGDHDEERSDRNGGTNERNNETQQQKICCLLLTSLCDC